MSSPPPIVHVGKRKAPPEDSAISPAAAEFSPSKDDADATAAKTDDGTLQSKSLVQKIQAILAEPKYSSIVSWNDEGTAFLIHDVDAFVSTIMPAHFQQSKFDSFTRRMRRWGFRCVKQRSPSFASLEPTQSNAMEFSCENFRRDQPELSLLMKDERLATKQFTFLDRNIRKSDSALEDSNPAGVVHYPPSQGGIMIPPSEIKQPSTVHYPPSSANMNTAAQKPEFQQGEVPSNNMESRLNMEMNYGYPHNYSQEQFATNLHPYHPAMPMISPARPYGYGPPAPQGFGFGPSSYSGSPSSQQQQQQQQRIMSIMDAKAYTSSQGAALMSSSSGDSSEVELLPNTKAKRKSQVDDEQNEV